MQILILLHVATPEIIVSYTSAVYVTRFFYAQRTLVSLICDL